MSTPSTAPSIGPNAPAAKCFHELYDAVQILERDADTREMMMVKARVETAVVYLGSLNVLLERQERVIEEQRVENVRLSKTNDRLSATDTENKQRLAKAQVAAEELVRDFAELVDRSTALFNEGRGIQLYRRDLARPHSVTINEPRVAAGR